MGIAVRFKNLWIALCLPILLHGSGCSWSQEAERGEVRLVVASGHTPSFIWVEQLRDFFLPEVERRLEELDGGFRIEWVEAYGGTLAKLGGVLEATEAGIVDLGLVVSLFEAPKLPLQNITFVTPFGPADITLVADTVTDLQIEIPAMGAAWTDHHLKFLGGNAIETYDLYTKFPVTRLSDLDGKKLLAPGIAANWIRETGAVAVAGTLATYYNDLKTGVADGALTLATGAWGTKLYEIANYLTRVDLGAQFSGALTINLDTWNRLPVRVQEIFIEVGRLYSTRQIIRQQKWAEQVLAMMIQDGLQVSTLSDNERKLWAYAIPNTAQLWAHTLERRGLPANLVLSLYMKKIRMAGANVPRDWSKE